VAKQSSSDIYKEIEAVLGQLESRIANRQTQITIVAILIAAGVALGYFLGQRLSK
jgi:hypothetical protein